MTHCWQLYSYLVFPGPFNTATDSVKCVVFFLCRRSAVCLWRTFLTTPHKLQSVFYKNPNLCSPSAPLFQTKLSFLQLTISKYVLVIYKIQLRSFQVFFWNRLSDLMLLNQTIISSSSCQTSDNQRSIFNQILVQIKGTFSHWVEISVSLNSFEADFFIIFLKASCLVL